MDATHSEVWRPIRGQEDSYEVSSFGRVRSLPRMVKRGTHLYTVRGRVVKPWKADIYGHVKVTFGRQKGPYLHQIVLEAFVGPRPEGMEACHNDGDPTNNALKNLRWDTASANQRDRLIHGTHHFARRTHCKHGHEYTPENTYIRTRTGSRYVNPSQSRVCRACQQRRGVLRSG